MCLAPLVAQTALSAVSPAASRRNARKHRTSARKPTRLSPSANSQVGNLQYSRLGSLRYAKHIQNNLFSLATPLKQGGEHRLSNTKVLTWKVLTSAPAD